MAGLTTMARPGRPGYLLGCGLAILAAAPGARAQGVIIEPVAAEDSAAAANAALFASHEVLPLRLEADLRRLRRDRGQDSEEHPARLTFAGPDGAPMTVDIEVKTRGLYRLQRNICGDAPPLRLDFKTKQVAGTVFEGEDKLKLGTHCRDRDEFEDYLLQEYLIYRMYNLFTDRSFRVRLARVTYVDAERRDSVTRYGFLIENDDRMAARNGMVVLEMEGIPQETTDLSAITQLSLFLYFIGNTDWSVQALHNIKLIVDVQQIPVAVPFDFDWSGMISPPYARPDPNLGIGHVRERLFISGCRTEEELAPFIARFNEQRDTIYALVRNQEGLREQTIARTLEYFDDFYRTINDPRRVRRELMRRCRG